jgi:hypothetical protein
MERRNLLIGCGPQLLFDLGQLLHLHLDGGQLVLQMRDPNLGDGRRLPIRSVEL